MDSSSRLRWTLEVEGLGPIRQARVESAPLTLLVGDNNSGKSYLAMLLWGIYTAPFTGLARSPKEAKLQSYQECLKLVQDLDETPKALDAAAQQAIFHWFSEALAQFGIPRLFNAPDMAVKSLTLSSPGVLSLPPLSFKWEKKEGEGTFSLRRSNLHFTVNGPERTQANSFILNSIFGRMVDAVLASDVPTYLPASRTGFMLLHRPVTSYAIRRAFGSGEGEEQEVPRIKLPTPALNFLEWLGAGPLSAPGPFAEEADALERLLGGGIEIDRSAAGVPIYQYRPSGQSALPMSLVSSLVSELAPIILVLRYAHWLKFLVIEEPEAHLHPRVQRVLARTIVRLVRRGVRVILTTHSDLFCQQINNCLKLGSLPEQDRTPLQERIGYDPQDFLLPEEVRGYSFQNTAEGSVVSALQSGPYGLEMPTFNKELERALEESQLIEQVMPHPAETLNEGV